MIAIISSMIIVISSLVVTLVTLNPNLHSIMENDFMRSGKNNAYLYSQEWTQLNHRAGVLTKANNKQNISLGDLSTKGADKDSQQLTANIVLDKTTGKDFTITLNQTVEKPKS